MPSADQLKCNIVKFRNEIDSLVNEIENLRPHASVLKDGLFECLQLAPKTDISVLDSALDDISCAKVLLAKAERFLELSKRIQEEEVRLRRVQRLVDITRRRPGRGLEQRRREDIEAEYANYVLPWERREAVPQAPPAYETAQQAPPAYATTPTAGQ